MYHRLIFQGERKGGKGKTACVIPTQKKGHFCFENIFSFNMEILKCDYIALIKEKYNCLNNCLPE